MENNHKIAPPADTIYTVSRLTREARLLLEGHFSQLWLEGEISNLARPSSGHWYFSLKDQQAQVRCAMFRGHNRLLNFNPQDGDSVRVRAKVSLYEGRGDFQLIVEAMEQAGDGALRLAFEQLKKRLAAEGLFQSSWKKPLPAMPQCIGVITSPSGAAIRDILTTLQRRFPAIPVIIYPSAVQGTQAAGNLCQALATANQRRECDVIILARGGGSLEDLWPFNEEAVARSIASSQIPIVSGVGHEVDVTIADFVADVRAATPTAAAELVVPHQQEWLNQLAQWVDKFSKEIRHTLRNLQQQMDYFEKRLVDPRQRLAQQQEKLQFLTRHLGQAQAALLQQKSHQCQQTIQRLQQLNPLLKTEKLTQQLALQQQRLNAAIQRCLQQYRHQLKQSSVALDSISPLATLARGYAIVSDATTKTIIRSTEQASIGQKITARLGEGTLTCQVEKIK